MVRQCGLRRMSFRPFTSESYAEPDRPEAWRDVLNTVGLQPLSAPTFYAGHATASRRSTKGVTLVKLAAGSQGLAAGPLADRVQAFEREVILSELKRSHNNMSSAAKTLGLERSHLYKKAEQLGIDLRALRREQEPQD